MKAENILEVGRADFDIRNCKDKCEWTQRVRIGHDQSPFNASTNNKPEQRGILSVCSDMFCGASVLADYHHVGRLNI
jgi:hypothetical protein